MFPLWKRVIEPFLAASGARRVVEIGALRGQTTVRLLDLLGPESEVHVIDPVPQFDPSEHEREFPGRYHFHRDLSLNVLPELGAVDVALIDGDHNWYTVFNELELLAAAARKAEAPLPLLIMHDVGWPYGRRDLYYAPEQIPEEFRHPYANKGLRQAESGLVENGGINSKMNNAVREGGPRNGVMTALDDFVAGYDGELRLAVLPIYFSLAIVCEEARIAAHSPLDEAFARLGRPAFLREMLKLSERLRIKEINWGQAVFYDLRDKLEHGARRYLELLAADLDDPPRHLDHLEACLETIREQKVAGDLVDCGSERAGGSVYMRGYVDAHGLNAPTVWSVGEMGAAEARATFERYRLLDDRVQVRSGSSPGELRELPIERIALLRIGGTASVGEALDALHERVTSGGFVVIEDCSEGDRGRELDEFLARTGLGEPPEPIEPGAVGWRKWPESN